MTGLTRTATIVAAMTLGALLPQAHTLGWMIRWLVMAMLFLVFLQVQLSRSAVSRSHFTLVAANIGLGFVGWGAAWLTGNRDLALAAFFCGITPTAAAAPVITGFLHGNVAYVVTAFLLTNISIAALMPLMLPVVLGHSSPDVFAQIAGTIGLVVFAPMGLAHVIRTIHPPAAMWPRRLRNVSFGMWVTAIFLATANASDFVRQQAGLAFSTLAGLAVVSLLLCLANFSLGRPIGGRHFGREASQSLGQKNTAFTIYLALTYASPLVALGPTFYIVWHNLWNSWQLHRAAQSAPAQARHD